MGRKSYVLGFIGIILLPIYAIYAVFAFIFHAMFYCCFGYRYDDYIFSSYRRDLKKFLYTSFCCCLFFSKKGRKKFKDVQNSYAETFSLIRFFINQVVLTTFDIASDIYQAGIFLTM